MKPTHFSDTSPIPRKYPVPRGDYIDDVTEGESWSRSMGQQQVLRGGDKDVNKQPTWE